MDDIFGEELEKSLLIEKVWVVGFRIFFGEFVEGIINNGIGIKKKVVECLRKGLVSYILKGGDDVGMIFNNKGKITRNAHVSGMGLLVICIYRVVFICFLFMVTRLQGYRFTVIGGHLFIAVTEISIIISLTF